MIQIDHLCWLILFTILGIYLRVYFIIKYKWVGKDTFYHLIVAENIRKYKKLPNKIGCFLFPEKYSYPPLFHILLALFNQPINRNIQFLSLLVELVTATTIFLYCYLLFNTEIAAVSAVFYILTPIVIGDSISLNPRPIANLFLTLSILFLSMFLTYGSLIFLIVAILSCTFTLLTHRLTTQSIVFALIAIAIYLKSLIPLIIIFVSISISIIITKGFYIKVMKGHFEFVKILGKKLIDKDTFGQINNPIISPVGLLFNVPYVIFLWILPSFLISNGNKNLSILAIWGLSILILSIFWIFGEGIRHMGNSIPPFAILFTYWSAETDNYTLIFIMIALLSLASIIKVIRLDKNPHQTGAMSEEMLHGIEYIKNNMKYSDIILSLPHDYTYNIAYFTNGTMLSSSGGFAKGLDTNQKLLEAMKNYGINKILREYKVKWVVVIRMDKMLKDFNLKDISNFHIEFRNDDIWILKQD